MTKIPRRHILSLMAERRVPAMAAGGPAPASAQGLHIVTPTHPTLARSLGLQTGTEFILGAGRRQVQIGDFGEPRRVRLCVNSGTTPASQNVGARDVAEGGQTVVPVGRCRVIEGASITVMPASPLGGRQRVKGLYEIVG